MGHQNGSSVSSHKVISKIILNRLKPYIAEIINPCQTGFVMSCKTSDNIFLVQEIIRTMVRKKGPKGYLAFKLDLDKAYDCLEWLFIQDTLEFFHIPPNLIQLITNMISSTRFHIAWNGSSISNIVPNRRGGGASMGSFISLFVYSVFGTIIHSFGRGDLGLKKKKTSTIDI